MKRLSILAFALALSACDQRGVLPTRSPAAPEPAAVWTLADAGAGAALILNVEKAERLRFVCLPATKELALVVPGVAPVGSEDRLSFGFQGEPFVFVVTPETLVGSGPIEGRAPLTPELLHAMTKGWTAKGVYGPTPIGPFPPPDPDMSQTFVNGCRLISGVG